MNFMRQVRRRFAQAAANLRPGKLYYVTDNADWAFHHVGRSICAGLAPLGLSARTTTDPWLLRRQIIHFGNRYAFLNRPYDTMHASNHLFLTWYHGTPDDGDAEIQALLIKLVQAAERLDGLVVTNRLVRDGLIAAGIAAGKIETIPLGVDLARFRPADTSTRARVRAELGIPSDAFCLGSFQKDGAGWQEGLEPKLSKGPDVFLDVLAKLKARRPTLFVLLTGPARGYVKAGLQQLGVPYRHDFLREYPDIVRYYQALDVYLICSRVEGGPLALTESWATGVPVVSTRVGMAADLVRHGENGLIAEVEDAECLAQCVQMFAEDAELREHCRRNALTDVQACDWTKIAAQHYEKLYEPVLTARK